MKNRIYRLYLRWFNSAAYGALLECDRLAERLAYCKKYHYQYKHIQERLYEMRAIFERLRK